MPVPIRYSCLSHPLDNLSQSITLDLPPPRTLEYYFASVILTSQKMSSDTENMADIILYTPPLPHSKHGIKDNNNLFFSNNNQPFPANQDKRKKLIWTCKLVANDVIEALEISSISLTKKGIKRRKRWINIPIHIISAFTQSQRDI